MPQPTYKMRTPGDGPGEGDPHIIVGKDSATVTLFSLPTADRETPGNSWRGTVGQFRKTFQPSNLSTDSK